MVGKIEIEVKSSEVTLFLAIQLIDFKLWKDHSPLGMIRVRQREKSLGKDTLVANLLGRHVRQLRPSDARRQFYSHPYLDGLGTIHHGRFGRTIT